MNMDASHTEVVVGSAPQPQYGSWWARAVCWYVDATLETVALFFFTAIFALLAGAVLWQVPWAGLDSLDSVMNNPVWRVVWSAYVVCSFGVGVLNRVVLQWYFGGSLGKLMVGLKVVNADGGELTLGRAVLRYACGIINTLTLGIGLLMPLWSERRQALHDLISGTIVVKR